MIRAMNRHRPDRIPGRADWPARRSPSPRLWPAASGAAGVPPRRDCAVDAGRFGRAARLRPQPPRRRHRPPPPRLLRPSGAARASLERIRALRAERPGDGLLVYYQAITHVAPRRARGGPGRAAQPARPAPRASSRPRASASTRSGTTPSSRPCASGSPPRSRAPPTRRSSLRLADPRLVPEGHRLGRGRASAS